MSPIVPQCLDATDPPLLPRLPLGTCVTECALLCTWLRFPTPPPSPTKDMSFSVPDYIHGWDPPLLPHPPLMTCISVPHCVHGWDFPLLLHLPLVTYLSVPHWVHATDPPLPYPPLGTCVTKRPLLRTCQRSSSSPTSSTGDMAEILLSSPIPHWGHVPVRVPYYVHGRDPILLLIHTQLETFFKVPLNF